ncbi:hypothetical protein BH11PSE3_BH11PSE3_00110 [soil metagenome]
MIFGMSLETFTFVHVVISLVGIMTGFITVALMLQSAPIAGWNAFFLVTTIVTSLGGYFFPFTKGLTPAHIVGAISLLILAVALYAIYGKKLIGPWCKIYVGTAVAALYLNFFVAIVQSFDKFAYLKKAAPTGSEPPFAVAQGIILILFIILGIAAARRYRPVD